MGTRIVLSLRLGFVVQRDHFCPLGRLEIFLALRSSGRVEIFCPSGLFELTRRPSGQKLSLVTTRVGPGDNKDSYPPLGQQFPTFGTKKISTLPWENKKSLFLPEKKKILKHFWAENTGKIVIWPWQEKIRLQP